MSRKGHANRSNQSPSRPPPPPKKKKKKMKNILKLSRRRRSPSNYSQPRGQQLVWHWYSRLDVTETLGWTSQLVVQGALRWSDRKHADDVCWYSYYRPRKVGRLRPSSDADLFMSRTEYLQLSTWKVRRLNQLRTAVWIRNASAVLFAWLSWKFRRGNGFDLNVELFMCRTEWTLSKPRIFYICLCILWSLLSSTGINPFTPEFKTYILHSWEWKG